ncbi:MULTISPECIES: ECF transporter S component [Clostridium]|jgi:riboflavin transporter FmnP|uniref:ECF transporter S component n=1 Tax=Clostridium TaxID=1485 RepID=UPI000289881D|nr:MULTISPECIES: ECF transporter S component [Clostridium]MDF2503502.1 putative rane protein [Clostridium sp.]
MKNSKLNVMTKTAILSVIGFLIMFIEVPIPIFPSFLKIDFSDLPALIGAFALGPVAGIIIELLKNILHGLFGSQTAFIGELANFLVGGIFVAVAGIIYKRRKTRTNALIGLAAGTIVMSIAASVLNYFVILPLYETVLHFPINAVVGMGSKLNPNIKNLNTFIVFAILPFNLIKGVIASVITMAVYKAVSPLIHKEAQKIETAQSKA